MELKPQDLLVAIKVFTLGNSSWSQRLLSQTLGMSVSEINSALKRATMARLLCKLPTVPNKYTAVPESLYEYLVHGAKYSFPANRGTLTRGVPTGMINPHSTNFSEIGVEDILVWPSPNGKKRGIGIEPLFPSVPDLVGRKENQQMYTLLALFDLIRIGRNREKTVAVKRLSELFLGNSKND